MSQPLIKNIVVIGGTGTGKSSFLNNLALVVRFATLEEALKGAKNFVPPIAVNMQFLNSVITDGKDDNERSEQASSRTLKPQVYRIKCGNLVLNLIDTPGMADSGGQTLDVEHVKHITTSLYEFKQIHGILILLKSSENTLNDSLKYTLNMVLSCLGKTAGKIVSFGITHADQNKNPGAAPSVIRKYLQDLKIDNEIDYSDSNLYCFESNPLFYVLSTKKGAPQNERNDQVYGWTFENNFDELLRYFSMVCKRKECYNVLNVRTLIIAKRIQPALAGLLPLMNSKDKEIKNILDQLEKDSLSKDSEYAKHKVNLKQVRQWTEEKEVTKSRVVNKIETQTKQRVVQEQYMDTVVDFVQEVKRGKKGNMWAAPFVLTPVAWFSWNKWKETTFGTPDTIDYRKVEKQVQKVRPKIEEFQADAIVPVAEEYKDIEYRDRVAIDEDPEVKQLLDKIEEERKVIANIQSEKSTLYQKFLAEKEMVSSLFYDLTSYLEEHAIIAYDKSGLGSTGNSQTSMFDWFKNLKMLSQWCPTSSKIGPDELIARLTAMQDSQHFGNEIRKILAQCENLEQVQYRMIDIPVVPHSVFFSKLVKGK